MNPKIKIAIGILIIGIILWWIGNTIHTKEVRVEIDKSSYQFGVEIKIKNNLDKSVWYEAKPICGPPSWWSLQKFENGTWREISLIKPCLPEYIITARIAELKPGSQIKERWTIGTYEIISKDGCPVFKPKTLEEGVYRVVFTYGFDEDSVRKKVNLFKAYSTNNLTIKEVK